MRLARWGAAGTPGTEGRPGDGPFSSGAGNIIGANSNGWFTDTDGALILDTGAALKSATGSGVFSAFAGQVGDGPWQDVKGLDEVGMQAELESSKRLVRPY